MHLPSSGLLALAAILGLAGGCRGVGSSALATGPKLAASSAPVRLSSTRDPARAQPLGVVEAHGDRRVATLDAIAEEFRGRVASLGGDVGRIDNFATRYEMVTETYSYDCSTTMTTGYPPMTTRIPRTCSGTRTVEVPTLTLTGRAFKAARGATP